MKNEKLTYILFGVFAIVVVTVITCGKDSSESSPAIIPDVIERVEEAVEEKVEEVEAVVEERVEEIKEAVEIKVEEVIEEIIPIKLPDAPKLDKIMPIIKEAPIEEAPEGEVEDGQS